ncbi:MAG: glycosyltransferase family 8 protein, partial [Elusimicrobiota bacterium]|nr:glycosyltransferase family 8 protein [Elusimicrobiota bacterium]
MKKEIPIFFSFNDDYVIPAAVAFHTLLYMAKEDVYYRMFVLHSDISETNRVLLGSIVNKHNNATIEFINTQDFLQKAWESGNFENQKKNSYKFTRDTIIRCFASQFFLQLDKIIYSDVDVVFMDDISELWDLDLEDNYIAAVKNAFMKFDNNELSHLSYENKTKFENTYFAGGIWVMNVKKIREDNLEKKML